AVRSLFEIVRHAVGWAFKDACLTCFLVDLIDRAADYAPRKDLSFFCDGDAMYAVEGRWCRYRILRLIPTFIGAARQSEQQCSGNRRFFQSSHFPPPVTCAEAPLSGATFYSMAALILSACFSSSLKSAISRACSLRSMPLVRGMICVW